MSLVPACSHHEFCLTQKNAIAVAHCKSGRGLLKVNLFAEVWNCASACCPGFPSVSPNVEMHADSDPGCMCLDQRQPCRAPPARDSALQDHGARASGGL
jgi:hypothetical protein